MDSCLGIITTGDIDFNFGVLCNHRPVYMLPFGGRYRLVDFAISNMVNHNLSTIALYTGEKINSTMDHLGNGEPWDLNRRFSGLFLFAPMVEKDQGIPLGDISQFCSTEEFFNRVKEENILVRHPNYLAKVNLTEAYKYFIDSEADITLIYHKSKDTEGKLVNCNKMYLDEESNLIDIGINLGTEETFNHFIRMAFLKKDVFLRLVKESREKGDPKFLIDAISQYRGKLKINAYEFKGHVESIKDLKSYYDANLNLLKEDVSKEVFYEGGQVFTKTKDEPSTYYTDESNVENSLVANGCIIKGKVENSIIFRGVKVGENAIVKNSIIMQKTQIQDGAIVVNSIIDKSATISEKVNIAGSSAMPYIVERYRHITND
ncbi:glucose-1-phosphate adenylyltransferase subunit GlgD [Clostridium sp. D2Q-11]|uniref:Glucose-1-phosphate adenylyltransferase subunit GlgD n=1 Tax=Anaeromonas frigoriresistens TaxID=2683708 RepID=A0A942UXY1_9FIRM|nr:glucose-1-phosphate adenylyltransferase subunit GlgD [Anaeromonas frigoriresistens]MBS4538366.1 glucose-1-phosphate adenylyltransferase subunit GlgD [Anaeromonas frigoriresistens]